MDKKDFPKDHLFLHLIKTRGFKRVAEIGVLSGNLVNRVLNGMEGIEKYYAVDPWQVYIEFYDREPHPEEKEQSHWDSLYERVKKKEEQFPALEVVRLTSVKAAKMLFDKGEELDCIYIDSIHDELHLVKDVYGWLTLVRDGGVVSGHDYTARYPTMTKAMHRIFDGSINCMILNPEKSALSFRNTHQGGNWWVEVTEAKKALWYKRMNQEFPEIITSVEEEWSRWMRL